MGQFEMYVSFSQFGDTQRLITLIPYTFVALMCTRLRYITCEWPLKSLGGCMDFYQIKLFLYQTSLSFKVEISDCYFTGDLTTTCFI